MLFRTHIVFSVAVYFLLRQFLVIEQEILFLVFVLIATAFVDIDSSKSKAGKAWYLRPFQIFFKHRGVVHSLLFAVLLSLILGSVSLWAGFGFFVGYVSHLFLDAWTKSGVGLFWPFKYRVRGFVRSGGIVEQVIFVLLLLGDLFVVGNMVFYHLF